MRRRNAWLLSVAISLPLLIATVFWVTKPLPVHLAAQAISPDRSKIALVYEEEIRPLVQTYTFVYIKPVDRPLDKRTDLVFRGSDMSGRGFGPVNVGWPSNDDLSVGYCSGRTEIFRNVWADLHAALPIELTVQLDQETPGTWPSSTPLNKQAGPPPCD